MCDCEEILKNMCFYDEFYDGVLETNIFKIVVVLPLRRNEKIILKHNFTRGGHWMDPYSLCSISKLNFVGNPDCKRALGASFTVGDKQPRRQEQHAVKDQTLMSPLCK